jgi:hypothetical protein
MSEGQKSVFLSYASKDRNFAAELGNLLRKRGARVFRDSDSIPFGSSWPEMLREELDKATAVILLLPLRDAMNRNSLWFEAGAAKALGKPVLMVLPPEHKATRSDVPVELADLVVLNADETSLDSLADTLLQAIPNVRSEASAD